MSNSQSYSPTYQKFLDFFSLTQRARLDGLDSTYFSSMSEAEKDMAFEYLKDGFEISEERLRGLYLCDAKKALLLFKDTLRQPVKKGSNKREDEAILMNRVLMAGYICNANPTQENINILVSLDVASGSEDTRSAFYECIPIEPTTSKAISRLVEGVLTEVDRLALASAASKLMASYGMLFDMRDNEYKRIYRGLINNDVAVKKQHMHYLQRQGYPVFI